MNEPAAGEIRVLLVGALDLFRASLRHYLSSKSDLEVTGGCGTTADALQILTGPARNAVDVVLRISAYEQNTPMTSFRLPTTPVIRAGF